MDMIRELNGEQDKQIFEKYGERVFPFLELIFHRFGKCFPRHQAISCVFVVWTKNIMNTFPL